MSNHRNVYEFREIVIFTCTFFFLNFTEMEEIV